MDVASEVRQIADRYLQKVKKSGPDNIMALCPFHDNQNTPAFTMSLSTGLYYCFSCGESGNLQMFLKNIGVTWNIIQRQYKDVIDATRSVRKKRDDPFVVLRGRRTSLSRRESSASSIISSQTSGRSMRVWISSWFERWTSASTRCTSA
jgi:hypothetical protein